MGPTKNWLYSRFDLITDDHISNMQCTVIGRRLSHMKWRETKQQLGWRSDMAALGCCLVSVYFLFNILQRDMLGRKFMIHLFYPSICSNLHVQCLPCVINFVCSGQVQCSSACTSTPTLNPPFSICRKTLEAKLVTVTQLTMTKWHFPNDRFVNESSLLTVTVG